MLILTREPEQSILIDDDIEVTIVRIDGNQIRVGIKEPRDVNIVRGELRKKEAGTD